MEMKNVKPNPHCSIQEVNSDTVAISIQDEGTGLTIKTLYAGNVFHI